MQKFILLAILVVLIALVACFRATTAPDDMDAETPTAVPTAESIQVATMTPTQQIATAAPTAMLATPSTAEPTAMPASPSAPKPPEAAAPTKLATAVPTPVFTPTAVTPTEAPTATSQAPTPTPTTATKTPPTPATTLVINVAPISREVTGYSRSQWKHWTDDDGDCQDTRQEVLVAESLVDVTYQSDRECRVETGRWYGAFTGTFVDVPGSLDVDHLVPLKNAHLSGGWAWSPEKREEYANYLRDQDHLIAVTAGANRSKGAKGPEEWKPPDEGYWCRYAVTWTEVKADWGLTMTERETEAVVEVLNTCEIPPEVEFREALATEPREHRTEPESSVYGSCENAAEAGEQRVQGSSGAGRGFPADMVPSARDGDGDGIVCER